MTKDITIISLQKEINLLENRIKEIEIQIKNKNKEKKTKDPNAPKKNVCNYFHFSKEFREEYLKKNPDTKICDVSKKAGEEWNNIKNDPKKKKKYDDMATKDKKRYEKEINEYKKN